MNSATLTANDLTPAAAVTGGQHAPQHMPSLDGLRGVAILLVLLHHFVRSINVEFSINQQFAHWTELGWTGVDLFFVLSGFLITGILYDAKNTPCYFRNFYARRSLRIFPLYYTALAVVLLLGPLLEQLKLLGTSNLGWVSIYATNIVLSAKGMGAFGAVDHFWSLAVEEHFYLVWPAFVYFLDRKRLMIAAAAACVVAPCLRLVIHDGGATLPVAAYILTPMRMDSLAAGAFIALFVRGPKGIEGLLRPAMWLAGASGAVFLGMVLFQKSKSALDPLLGTAGYSVLWLFFGSVLVLALTWEPLKRLMSLPILRWFGKYSYGMYVWHPIILLLVYHNDVARRIRGGNDHLQALLSTATAIAAVLAITLLSWNLIEKQFLKMKARFA